MDSGSIDDVLDTVLEVIMGLGGSVGDSVGGGLGSFADLFGPVLDGLAIASGGEPAEIAI